MKKILKQIFSQKALFILLMLLQVLFLGSSIWFFSANYAFVYAFLIVIDILLVIYINSSRDNPAYKMMWIVIITLLPIFGGIAYIYTKNQISIRALSKNQTKRLLEVKQYLPQGKNEYHKLKKENEHLANLSEYIYNYANLPIYQNTKVTYLSVGEMWYKKMKEEMLKARHYIFMEYFIIAEGKMWEEISDILSHKADEGVEIRILYDGIGTGFITSRKKFRFLEKKGVKIKEFNPFRPFLSTIQNNRDHRKIAVIDGMAAFNGGTNIADEYINEKLRFGHWKDTAVMIKGDAVKSFVAMFLQLWEREDISQNYLNKYFPADDVYEKIDNKGFVQPYTDSPLDKETVGKLVYLDLINMAEERICIMTPYLIPDDELVRALELAAKKGIDVSIIMPHHPDKWYVYKIAWSFYEELIDYGIKIYEYLPGFVHAKSFLIDDKIAVVGTINLDYRSLYLHFECATLFYKCSAVDQLKADCSETIKKCVRITKEACVKQSFLNKLVGNILRLFAPLL